jgi:hypothetical protein
MAMAYTLTIRPIIEQIQLEVLEEGKYLDIRTGEILTDIKKTHWLSRSDMVDFDQKTHTRYLAAGFKVAPGYCPLLQAESLEREAKIAMIEISQELSPNFNVQNVFKKVKYFNQYVELLLRLLAPYVDDRRKERCLTE